MAASEDHRMRLRCLLPAIFATTTCLPAHAQITVRNGSHVSNLAGVQTTIDPSAFTHLFGKSLGTVTAGTRVSFDRSFYGDDVYIHSLATNQVWKIPDSDFFDVYMQDPQTKIRTLLVEGWNMPAFPPADYEALLTTPNKPRRSA